MSTICITNTSHETRSCLIRTEHLDECDGYEYTWHEELGRDAATGNNCRGCLPRPAAQGQVCAPCWALITSALAGYPEFKTLLAGVDRAVSPQSDGWGAAGPRLPFTTLQEALVVLDELHTIGARTPEQWVKFGSGALDAVMFARAYTGAAHAHPVKELPSPVPLRRCPRCDLKALTWRPPTAQYSDVLITCRNPECTFESDQTEFEAALVAPKEMEPAL